MPGPNPKFLTAAREVFEPLGLNVTNPKGVEILVESPSLASKLRFDASGNAIDLLGVDKGKASSASRFFSGLDEVGERTGSVVTRGSSPLSGEGARSVTKALEKGFLKDVGGKLVSTGTTAGRKLIEGAKGVVGGVTGLADPLMNAIAGLDIGTLSPEDQGTLNQVLGLLGQPQQPQQFSQGGRVHPAVANTLEQALANSETAPRSTVGPEVVPDKLTEVDRTPFEPIENDDDLLEELIDFVLGVLE